MSLILWKRPAARLLGLVILSSVWACGQKGPLYLEPARPAATPGPAASAPGGPSPAAASAPTR